MPSARTVPPRNPMDRASAEATRPIRRRPDIAWRNSLSSKVFVVGRYDFSGRTPLERTRWKALCRIPGYGTRRPIGRGRDRGVSGMAGEGVTPYRHRNAPIREFRWLPQTKPPEIGILLPPDPFLVFLLSGRPAPLIGTK